MSMSMPPTYYLRELGPEAQAKLFRDNAVRIYDVR